MDWRLLGRSRHRSTASATGGCGPGPESEGVGGVASIPTTEPYSPQVFKPPFRLSPRGLPPYFSSTWLASTCRAGMVFGSAGVGVVVASCSGAAARTAAASAKRAADSCTPPNEAPSAGSAVFAASRCSSGYQLLLQLGDILLVLLVGVLCSCSCSRRNSKALSGTFQNMSALV